MSNNILTVLVLWWQRFILVQTYFDVRPFSDVCDVVLRLMVAIGLTDYYSFFFLTLRLLATAKFKQYFPQ